MKIYQIFYDQNTKNKLDPEFIPFDNTNPSEPSWFEFEPIKKILESNFFDDNEYVGIFSPRFFEKTGMSGSDVIKILEKSKSDVISFSPNLPSSVLYLNSFHQGDAIHPGLLNISMQVNRCIGLKLDLENIVSTQYRTIFSNYFVAKYSFWKFWLSFAIKIYFLSKNKSNLLSKKLIRPTFYKNRMGYQMKVFIMERLVNTLLEFKDINCDIGIDYEKYVLCENFSKGEIQTLIKLNDLKKSFLESNDQKYIQDFFEKRVLYLYLTSRNISNNFK